MLNLNQYQDGFRKGRGCVDHIVRLKQDIALSSNKKRMTLGAFLDLEKYFDTERGDHQPTGMTKGVELFMYADDIALWTTGTSL